jgi:pimeloyl-ACP methyl ester carboxylesterase
MNPHRTAGGRRVAAWRLSAGLQGSRQDALAEGRRRGQTGGSDSTRRVRRLGRRDLGHRSRGRQAKSADAAGAERRHAGQQELLERRQGPVRSRKITVPTLLLHAEWDADLPSYLAQGYFAQLKNTPHKRLIELSAGTHTVMMEKNRMQFFRELMGFLDEEKPLALK